MRVCAGSGHVESLLLTNSNTTTASFNTAALMRSPTMTSSSDYSSSGWSDMDDDSGAVGVTGRPRRSLVYTDGRAGTLRCVAVALSAPTVRVEVYMYAM